MAALRKVTDSGDKNAMKCYNIFFHRCWGDVGYRRGKAIISMGDGCEYKFVMMHELGHIIGFYHEHNRPDRDEFIEIFWDNIVNCKDEAKFLHT